MPPYYPAVVALITAPQRRQLHTLRFLLDSTKPIRNQRSKFTVKNVCYAFNRDSIALVVEACHCLYGFLGSNDATNTDVLYIFNLPKKFQD